MKVKLVGYNQPVGCCDKDYATPEVLSAAFARTSRSKLSLEELVENAKNDVPKARKSNKSIIYDMGHSSIAEHAYFNLILEGISRRVIEEIERHRLVSYTEKSQRYVTFNGDYTVPDSIVNSGYEDEFRTIVEECNSLYKELFDDLFEYNLSRDFSKVFALMGIVKDKIKERTMEGWSKEDARYILPMATQTQLAESINGRSLEYMIKVLRSSEIKEARDVGDLIYSEIEGLAPSLIKYTKPTDFFRLTDKRLRSFVSNLLDGKVFSNYQSDVFIHNVKNDESVAAALIFTHSDLSFTNSLKVAHSLTYEQLRSLFQTSILYKESYDPMPREYEVGNHSYVVEFTLSSSAFAQLKRHRIATLLSQHYLTELGVVVPDSIKKIGYEDRFLKLTNKINSFYKSLILEGINRSEAEYILTNSHKRRVLFIPNLREMHAVAHLRMDPHAQLEIRSLISEAVMLWKNNYPLSLEFAGGKHDYYERKKKYLEGL